MWQLWAPSLPRTLNMGLIVGTDSRRSITTVLPGMRECLLCYSKETPYVLIPIGYNGGHCGITFSLCAGEHRIGLPIQSLPNIVISPPKCWWSTSFGLFLKPLPSRQKNPYIDLRNKGLGWTGGAYSACDECAPQNFIYTILLNLCLKWNRQVFSWSSLFRFERLFWFMLFNSINISLKPALSGCWMAHSAKEIKE